MTDDASGRRPLGAGLVLFALVFALIATDIVTDWGAGASLGHVLAEVAVLVLSGIGVVLLWRALWSTKEAVAELTGDVARARREARRWQAEAHELLDGLRLAIEQQFDRWSLTPAERAVTLLLLEGLGHKEIAARRRTSERTVRQQAQAVYQKAGLSGRSELAGFFLGGLLGSDGQAGSGMGDRRPAR